MEFSFEPSKKIVGELNVSKNESIQESNRDTGEIYSDGSSIFDNPTLKSSRIQAPVSDFGPINDTSDSFYREYRFSVSPKIKEYMKDVKSQDIIDAMFLANDLSETDLGESDIMLDCEDYEEQAGQIVKQVKEAVDEAKTFDEVHIYDKLDNDRSLPEDYKKKKAQTKPLDDFVNSERGKATLDEIGIKVETNTNGSKVYKLNDGTTCELELKDNGVLSVAHKIPAKPTIYKSLGPNVNGVKIESFASPGATRIAEFKLNDGTSVNTKTSDKTPISDEQKNETSSVKNFQYSVNGSSIELEKYLTDNGFEPNIYGGNAENLLNQNKQEIEEKLEKSSGKKIDDLKSYSNHFYYIDNNGTEHQYYYDNKTGEFINANVTKNTNGGYNVDVTIPNAEENKTETKPTPNENDDILKSLSDEDKKILLKLVEFIKQHKTGSTQEIYQYDHPKFADVDYRSSTNSNVNDIAKAEFEKIKQEHPDISDNLLDMAFKMSETT